MNHPILGILHALLAAFFAASMAASAKFAEEIPFETVVFFRNLFSFLVIAPFLFRKRATLKTKHLPRHFLRSVVALTGVYLLFYTIKHLNLTNAILLRNTIPLFAPIVLLLWKKMPICKWQIFTIFLGFVGVLCILEPSANFVNFVTILGLLGAICGVISQIFVRDLSQNENPTTITFYYFLFALVLSFFPMAYQWEPVESSTLWVFLILTGLFAALYQYYLAKASTEIPVTEVSSLFFISVFIGGLYDWVFWKDFPDIFDVIGAFLVIAGGIGTLFTPALIKRKRE